MARLYCVTCRELVNDHYSANPATGKLHCRHCETVLVDFDEIDRAVKTYEVMAKKWKCKICGTENRLYAVTDGKGNPTDFCTLCHFTQQRLET